MGFFENKQPLWIDLDAGITGTFVRFEEHTTEKDHVYPVITPFNSFKKIRYARPVPMSSVITMHPKTIHQGVENAWMVLYEGGDESIVNFIDKKNIERVRDLEEKNNTLEIENRSLQQQLNDAREGLQKEMKGVKDLTKGTQPTINDQFGDRQKQFFEDLN